MAFNNTPLFIAQNATTTTPGVIILTNHLSQNASGNPTVVSANGVSLPDATATPPSAGQVLTANSATAASWQTPAGASSVAKRVTTDTYSISLTPNCSTTDIYRVTLGGNPTFNTPSGTPVDGQQLQVHFIQDGTGSRVVTYGPGYAFSTDIPSPTLSTAASATDYLGFQYSAAKTKWLLLGVVKGF